MGNNAAGNSFAHTIIAVYDAGVLTKEIAKKLAQPYHESDIDLADACEMRSKDGLDVEQIVATVFGHLLPKRPDLPSDYNEWTKKQDRLNEKFYDMKCRAFKDSLKAIGIEFH